MLVFLPGRRAFLPETIGQARASWTCAVPGEPTGQRLYYADARPEEAADVVVYNDDLAMPRLRE